VTSIRDLGIIVLIATQRSYSWLKLKPESNVGFDSKSEPERGRRIIDVGPSATIATTKLHPDEPNELEEGECLFHSYMWVKRYPDALHH
jgi:hypothetical protein